MYDVFGMKAAQMMEWMEVMGRGWHFLESVSLDDGCGGGDVGGGCGGDGGGGGGGRWREDGGVPQEFLHPPPTHRIQACCKWWPTAVLIYRREQQSVGQCSEGRCSWEFSDRGWVDGPFPLTPGWRRCCCLIDAAPINAVIKPASRWSDTNTSTRPSTNAAVKAQVHVCHGVGCCQQSSTWKDQFLHLHMSVT